MDLLSSKPAQTNLLNRLRRVTQQPDLSVVMPVFNEEARVTEAIERVLQQDFVAELIVVDDGFD